MGWCLGDQSHAVGQIQMWVRCNAPRRPERSSHRIYGPLKLYTNSLPDVDIQSTGTASYRNVLPRGVIHPEFSSKPSSVQSNSCHMPSRRHHDPEASSLGFVFIAFPLLPSTTVRCNANREAVGVLARIKAVERGFGWMFRRRSSHDSPGSSRSVPTTSLPERPFHSTTDALLACGDPPDTGTASRSCDSLCMASSRQRPGAPSTRFIFQHLISTIPTIKPCRPVAVRSGLSHENHN